MDASAPITAEQLLGHEAFVLALARHLVRDEATAEDVAQETWMSALRSGELPRRIRPWLARIVRRRASDARRAALHRSEHEHAAGRGERLEPGPSALERLELAQQVVRAVLSLEEPYRGVVIDVYYLGLAPSESARRRRVADGTLRSQLSRALEMLREKLDRGSGGDRRAWALSLAGLLRRKDLLAKPALSAAVGSTAAVWLSSAAAVAALAGGTWWYARTTSGSEPPAVAAANVETSSADSAALPAALATDPTARIASQALSEPAAGAPVATAAEPTILDELPGILLRTRQIKTLVLERRLEVEAAVRREYAWLERDPQAGLAKLVNRTAFGFEMDLPWMHGGGAYWSFTERVHDFWRRPQIELQRKDFNCGFLGSYEGAVLDLGEGTFRALAEDPSTPPAGLDERTLAAWRILRGDYALDSQKGTVEPRPVTLLRGIGLDDETEALAGHTYLIRAISPGEFDATALIEVARLEGADCTLAWKLVESRPIEKETRPVHVPVDRREDLPPPPEDLEAKPEAELLAELGVLRAKAETLLFESAASLDPSWTAEAQGVDGVTRILDGSTPWTELPRSKDGGCHYSFEKRVHGYQVGPDLNLEAGQFHSRFAGLHCGAVLDTVTSPGGELLDAKGSNDAVRELLLYRFPHAAPREEQEQEARNRQAMLRDRRLGWAPAVEGHTYLVRSIHPGEHDLLATFRVRRLDDYGAVIAWRILQRWDVPRSR